MLKLTDWSKNQIGSIQCEGQGEVCQTICWAKKKKLNFWSNTTKQPTLHSEAVEGGMDSGGKKLNYNFKEFMFAMKMKKKKKKKILEICLQTSCVQKVEEIIF